MKTKIKGIILILISALILPYNTVSAIPPIAEQYYGSVTLDGLPADGVSITAEMNGRTAGSDSASGGSYSLTINTIDGDLAGDNIDFYVDGNYADSSNLTPGAFTQLDLSATSPPPEYTLTINENGNGSTNGAGTYTGGDVANITADPDYGWEFVNWTGDISEIANPDSANTTITMNDDYTITANFVELPTYNLTIDENGEGRTTGGGPYPEGEEANIRAIPDNGWVFDEWSGDTNTIEDPLDATTTIIMNDDYYITANFSEAEIFTLTIAVSGSGTTNPAIGTHEYQEGEEVNISAIPAEGWQFVSWTGDVANPSSPNTTVTVDSDKTITANFSPVGVATYNLTITINGQGTTSPPQGIYTYAEGTVVDITANPANGWVFVNWSGDTGTIDDINDTDITIQMNGNYSIIANFSELPKYTLTITTEGEGSPSGAGIYYQGERVNIRANPASGWKFVNWSGNTDTVADVNSPSTTIVMDDNYTITANFTEVDTYTLTIAVNGSGSTNPAIGEHQYEEGTVVDLNAIPDQEWQFVSWGGDVENANAASTTIIMDKNQSITANFSPFGTTTYILSILISGQGSTSPSDGDHSYLKGKVVSITAIPEDGWYFVNWSGDTKTIANVNDPTATITINNDAEVTANFEKAEDNTAPAIPVVLTSNISKTGVDIFWITDEPGDSQVEYWASPGQLTPIDTTLTTEHLVRLTGLKPSTTYHFKVMSKDAADNLMVSDEYTFITMGAEATFFTSNWATSIEEVDNGKEVNISFTVDNGGDIAGSYKATLIVNGEVEETQDIVLNAGASEDVTFTITRNANGAYQVAVGELMLSFAIEPGSGTNWWLIVGIAAGVLFLAVLCVFYIIRRGPKTTTPTLEITEEVQGEEEYPEMEVPEGGAGGKTDSLFYGMTVTQLAMFRLKEILQSKTTDKNTAFRITTSDTQSNQLKMILDQQREGDKVLESEGAKILLLGSDIIPMLKRMKIDYQITPQGGGFTISKLSPDE